MFTLGYRFRPWTDAKAIADGAVDPRLRRARPRASTASTRTIRYGHRVVRARVVDGRRALDGRASSGPTAASTVALTCRLPVRVHAATTTTTSGYTPEFPGAEHFARHVVHPQHWPEDLDYAGKRVVVIGSGATAVTLVPAMAERRPRT